MEYKIRCVGLLTSGGDAPGMNAAIRAVTRTAIFNGIRVKAIYRGYKGLITGEVKEFRTQDVSNIIQHGGTILKTARCMEFKTKEGRQIAYETMVREEIDALVVIGGDGTFTGARIFAQEYNIPIVGLPGTIDNDLWGTDSTTLWRKYPFCGRNRFLARPVKLLYTSYLAVFRCFGAGFEPCRCEPTHELVPK